jgi:NADP-dependent 3-hydroxy acid dehydrogenase YdfG
MTDLERWRDRVALVTGATSGIGEAVAHRLARAGMRVAATGRRLDRLAKLQTVLAPAESLAVAADLRDEAQIEALFARVAEKWGGVDVIVNAAGLGHAGGVLEGTSAAWRETLEVNVLALALCTRAAVEQMRRSACSEGHVIHIASMSSHRVPQGSGMYAASKFAVRALTEALRQELLAETKPIRVTAISPGFVRTEFHRRWFDDEAAARATYARFRILDPADVAEMVAFALAAPAHVQVHDLLVRPRQQPE